MNSSDFFRAHWSRHLCCKALVDRQACIYIYVSTRRNSIKEHEVWTHFYCDISPSLVDPALLSVVRVVDGQFTGFITKEEDFHLHIYRAHWSRLLCFWSFSRPAGQLKERDLWRHIQSANRVLPTKQRSWSRDSPNRSRSWSRVFADQEGRKYVLRAHVYCDSSPCFADPTLLSVVGFCGL